VGHLAEWAPEAAVVVPPGDPAALADAVAALLGDEERRLGVALEAQSRALAEHADHTAARVLQIYDELTR
jgi:glycosyltransferase involved in cell wall biosynthesis